MSSALIVIDVQESFRQRPNWPAISHPEIAKQVHRLAEAFRARDEMIVWVLHTEPGTGGVFDPSSEHVWFMEGLEPADGEPILDALIKGDTVREVLNYVQFKADTLVTQLRKDVEAAVREGRMGYEESGRLLRFYEDGLHGYTYLEDPHSY